MAFTVAPLQCQEGRSGSFGDQYFGGGGVNRKRVGEGGYGTNNGKPFLGGGGGGGGFHTLTEHKYEKFEKEYPERTHILGQHVPIDFL